MTNPNLLNVHRLWINSIGFLMVVGSLLLMPLFAQSQQYTQTIRGKVIDQDTRQPLFGAHIRVTSTDSLIASTTGEEGTFNLKNVPVGRQNLKVTHVRYEPKMLKNLEITSGKEVVLEVGLREKVYEGEEITIVGEKDKRDPNNKLAPISARQFTVEETDRFAGTRQDPSRMASNYAGVKTANDARNDIIVRGNSPLGVLWRLEGMDIPNPNHFSTQGATGGPVSILNNNLLDNSDFLSGAFPAEYGNKTAAVFDIQMREGNNQQMEYTGQVGINGFEAGVEGPISRKQGSSFLANYRYSTLKAFDLLGINFGTSGIPRYQDFSTKVHVPTENAGKFSLVGVGGKSDIRLLESEQDTSDWSLAGQGQDIVYGSDMGVIGLTHFYSFGENTFGRGGVSGSGNNFRITVDTVNSKGKNRFMTYKNRSKEGQLEGFYNLTHKVNTNHLVKGGIRYQQLFVDYQEKYFDDRLNQYVFALQEEENTGLLQGYIHWRFRITGDLTLQNGLHYQNFLLNESQVLEPRSGITWSFHPDHQLSAAYGLHSQTQPMLYYFMETYDAQEKKYRKTNQNLGFTKSHHAVLGYDYFFGSDFRLKAEVYYQSLFNVPVQRDKKSHFSMINVGGELEGLPQVDSLVNEGTGRNYGIDLTVEKFFSDHYYFLVTGSLYRSLYEGSDGVQRPSRYSSNYALNVLGGVDIPLGSENHTMGVNLRYALAGGHRYIPIDLEASRKAGQTVYETDRAFEEQYKPYSRLDLKVDFELNHKNVTQSFFATVENVLNQENILRRVYSPEAEKIVTDYQLGIFPYGGYRITF